MFEGIALGTRIAALGRPCATSAPAIDQNHVHGAEQSHHFPTPAPAAAGITTTGPKTTPTYESHSSSTSADSAVATSTVSMRHKLLLAAAFAIVTPLGMGIGIGVLHRFNGNDPSTIIAIGTLDALSAGILIWVGVVEMWAHDWMLGGEMTRASPVRTALGLTALVVGMAVMSLLGKWA